MSRTAALLGPEKRRGARRPAGPFVFVSRVLRLRSRLYGGAQASDRPMPSAAVRSAVAYPTASIR
ncbi:hypothetical protein RKD37_002583 [Streptomyces ambofaciens]